MKTNPDCRWKLRARGFSLIELMVVVGIVSLVLAAILTQVSTLQQRAAAEQGKVDDFQQARDFLDQIFMDTRQMGYPNVRNIDPTAGTWAPAFCTTSNSCLAKDSRLAVGLIKLTPTELDFEGDVNGSGTVSIVSYKINGSGTCATCIQRAQVSKVSNGTDSLAQTTALAATAYSVEVQNVQNTTAIFTAYDSSGNAVALPIDMDANPTIIPTVRVIQAQLKIASPTALDPKTGLQLEADIEGRVQVVNCSMASTGIISTNGIRLTCQ